MKDKLITWSILLVLMVVSILPGFAQTTQLDITGNLVNNSQTTTTTTSTWQGATFQSSLTCWAWGDPGYCGPNPIVRPDGNINFSFGLVDLHQRVNVAKALPYGGSGLVTTGFRFQWTSKNGNGWDDGRLDQLDAYVKLYNTGDSKTIESFNYNLNFIHDWTTYTWEKNWANTKVGYRENQVGNVQFGFVGMDNNYWAGPYGPEVREVSFQLKYKPDPCKNNPLFSPECPNFQEELNKNIATVSLDQPKLNSDTYDQRPPPEYKEPKDNNFVDYERYEEGYTEYDPSDRLIDTLFKIFDNQSKEDRLTMQTAENAVKETDNTAQQTVKQAEKIAEKLTKDSIANSMLSQPIFIVDAKDNKQNQSTSLFQQPSVLGIFSLVGVSQQTSTNQLYSNSNLQQTSNINLQEQTYKPPVQSSLYALTNNQAQQDTTTQISVLNAFNITANQSSTITNTNQTLALINPLMNQVVETPNLQSNFLTNRADPVNSILENKPILEKDSSQENKTTLVKQNVQDNDAAGGVSISNIAITPVGFNAYTIALADAAFYPPKEIYRNQRVVDNQRVLRQLSTDRLHQEMIELQYRSVR
jgi:hypothetical protein